MKKTSLAFGLCLIATTASFPLASAGGPGDICIPSDDDSNENVCACVGIHRYVVFRNEPAFFHAPVVVADPDANVGVFVSAGRKEMADPDDATTIINGWAYYMTGEAPNALACKEGVEHCLESETDGGDLRPQCLIDIDACALLNDLASWPFNCGLPTYGLGREN